MIMEVRKPGGPLGQYVENFLYYRGYQPEHSLDRFLPAARLIPKKTYLSFTDVREFVAVNLRPGELRLCLDLGNEPFSTGLRKAVLTGPMPRFTHMLVLGPGMPSTTFSNPTL